MISKWMACLLAGTALAGVAHAADPAPIRITVIADLNDDLYDARAGRGGVDATRMAVADFGGPPVVPAPTESATPAEPPTHHEVAHAEPAAHEPPTEPRMSTSGQPTPKGFRPARCLSRF